jgi:coenzyme F420-0:L-glutamate ligase/coenzyme F420-1:gamma-L-glutamate ligase
MPVQPGRDLPVIGITATPLYGMPLFDRHTDLTRELCAAIDRAGEVLAAGDIVVLAQKIVSKREGRTVEHAAVSPGQEALRVARETAREPEMVQLILDESSELLRATPAAIIARHRTGHVLANAGIDASNVQGGDTGTLLLWPADPDASARAIRSEIAAICGVRPAVVIADSMGRAWRIGTVGTAIGCAGLTVIEDKRGTGRDLFGRVLQATQIAIADSVAALASLAMGESDEGTPAALVRGARAWVSDDDGPGAVSGLRPIEQDMFR